MALKRGRKPAPKKPPEEKCYCRRCRRTLAANNFYQATNKLIDTNDRMSICKECCNDIYNGFFKTHKLIDTALFYTCQEIDLRYEPDIVEATKTRIASIQEKGNDAEAIVGYYKSNLSSTGEKNFGYSEFQFRDSAVLKLTGEKPPAQYDPDEYQSIEVSYLRSRWGDMQIEELQWLEERYNTFWDRKYDIDGARQMLVEQICFTELSIKTNRAVGKDMSKELKTIQDLLKTANLSPRMENASEEAEFQTLGEFIKRVEQSKPIINKNPDYVDVDKFKNMWKSLAGALKRTIGKPDEDTETFKEVYKEHTLDLSNLESGDD